MRRSSRELEQSVGSVENMWTVAFPPESAEEQIRFSTATGTRDVLPFGARVDVVTDVRDVVRSYPRSEGRDEVPFRQRDESILVNPDHASGNHVVRVWAAAIARRRMRLQEWWSNWIVYEFDPRTSRFGRRLRGKRHQGRSVSGCASVERIIGHGRTLFAVYGSGDQLFFHAGGRTWDLARRDVAFHFQTEYGRAISHFRVVERGGASFVYTYRHRFRSITRWFDPAIDDLDDLHDHFLKYVADGALDPEWQTRMKTIWAP